MMPRFLCLLPTAAIVLLAAGCGQEEALRPAQSVYYTDPADYWGVYKGTLINREDAAIAESTDELIGSSYLTLDTEDGTFTMTHEGIDFGGTTMYRTMPGEGEERMRIIELKVSQVGTVSRVQIGRIDLERNKAAGRRPSTPEELETYMQIFDGIKWYFELLPDGFRHLDLDGVPGIYEFRRDSSESAAAIAASNSIGQTGTDGADGSGDDPLRSGIENVGGG